MNKREFLEELKSQLSRLEQSEAQEILDFYDERIRNGIFEGQSEEDVVRELEAPSVIARNTYQEYGLESGAPSNLKTSKIHYRIAPVVVLLYLLVGFTLGAWTKGVLLFLVLPLQSLLHDYTQKRINIANIVVFASTGIYLGIGFLFGIWHPTWLIFLAIPLFLSRRANIVVFVSTGTYLAIGFLFGVWHPTWLIFLAIPLLLSRH